jgi:hypothetical protein
MDASSFSSNEAKVVLARRGRGARRFGVITSPVPSEIAWGKGRRGGGSRMPRARVGLGSCASLERGDALVERA